MEWAKCQRQEISKIVQPIDLLLGVNLGVNGFAAFVQDGKGFVEVGGFDGTQVHEEFADQIELILGKGRHKYCVTTTLRHYDTSLPWYQTIGYGKTYRPDRVNAKRNPEVRVYLDPETNVLVKALAALMNVSVSEFFNEALEEYLQTDRIRELIDRHNLDQIQGNDEAD